MGSGVGQAFWPALGDQCNCHNWNQTLSGLSGKAESPQRRMQKGDSNVRWPGLQCWLSPLLTLILGSLLNFANL